MNCEHRWRLLVLSVFFLVWIFKLAVTFFERHPGRQALATLFGSFQADVGPNANTNQFKCSLISFFL